jgi:small subunit ribosomal protein S6
LSAQVYEGLYILDSNRYGRDATGVSGQINEIIQNAGGEVLASRLWEERRLAYPIRGQRKGTYWLTYFRLESTRLGEITRQCEINDNIMRSMHLRVDPRIVDTLVSHALSGSPVLERKVTIGAEEEPAVPAVESA